MITFYPEEGLDSSCSLTAYPEQRAEGICSASEVRKLPDILQRMTLLDLERKVLEQTYWISALTDLIMTFLIITFHQFNLTDSFVK